MILVYCLLSKLKPKLYLIQTQISTNPSGQTTSKLRLVDVFATSYACWVIVLMIIICVVKYNGVNTKYFRHFCLFSIAGFIFFKKFINTETIKRTYMSFMGSTSR